MPYTYSGGGGPIGNRYFVSFYPLFLFLMPAVRSAWPAVIGLAIGALFVAKILLNPFYSSFNPGEHAKAGPLRVLPIERTLLNDLPVSADAARARRSLGGNPAVQAYFIDDNAYPPEGDGFWVRGESRADLLLRAPATQTADNRNVSLRIRALSIEVTNGASANRVVVSAGWERVRLDLAPGEVRYCSGHGGRRCSIQAVAVPHQLRVRAVDFVERAASSRSCTTRATPTAAISARSSASRRSISIEAGMRSVRLKSL